jgi:predicted nucleic acid-binding Zn ribbon protein
VRRIGLSEIHQIFFRHGLGEEFFEQEPAIIWAAVVGARIARLTQPIWVRDGVLFVEVFSHAAQQELSFLQEEFKQKLNQALGEERVSEIRFRVGPRPEDGGSLKPPEAALAPAELAEIDAAVSTVESPALRDALAAWMAAVKKREKVRLGLGWKPCSGCGVLHEPGEELCPICRVERQYELIAEPKRTQ